MKFLIAFALFAVAFADIEPFRLREPPAPAFEVSVDYPYVVEIVHSPIAAVSSTANIVKVADFVKGTIGGVKASFDDAEPLYDTTVKFVDIAVNEENLDNESLVKVVESPLEEATPSDFAVKVVDEAVNEINDIESLKKVMTIPVEEAAPSDIAGNFVDAAQNDLSDANNVKVVESPLEEAGPVNFVNEAVNEVTSDAEIAPSFDSYAGISKLMKSAQEEKYVEGSSTVIVVPSLSFPEVNIPTAVNVVENAVNMGHMLAVGIEDSYEDTVDVHAKDEYYDGGIPANVVRVAEFPRGKVFDNPMLR